MRLRGRTLRRLLIVAACAGGVAALTMTLVFVSRQRAERNAAAARTAGLAAHERGDFEVALDDLSRALAHDSEDLPVLLAYADSRARVRVEKGRHLASAVNRYNEVLRLDPGNTQALEALLSLYGRLGWRRQAREVVDRILTDVDPDHVAALAARAGMQFADKNHSASIATLERLIELEPRTLSWRLLLIDVMWAADVSDDELLAVCDRWTRSPDGVGLGELVKARVLWRLGSVGPAAEALVAAAEHGASTPDQYQQLVRLFDEMTLQPGAARDEALLRRLAAARSMLIDTVSQEHDAAPWVHEALIVRHWREGELDAALAAAEQATASLPEADHRILLWKAAVLWGRGDWGEADAVLSELENLSPALDASDRSWVTAWTRAFRAEQMQDRRPWQETFGQLTEAVEFAPGDAVVQFVYARACRRAGAIEQAVRAYERAAVLDPLWVGPQLVLAELLLELERPERALRRLAALHQRALRPGLRLHLLTARAWVDAGRADRAIFLSSVETGRAVNVVELLQTLRAGGERLDLVVPLLVRAHRQRGELNEADAIIRDELASEPADHVVLLALVPLCDDPGLAAELLERAEAEGGAPTEAVVIARARHRAAAGDTAGAVAALEGLDAVAAIRLRSQLLAGVDAAGAIDVLRTHLQSDETAAQFVLAQPVAWTDRSLVEDAIASLEAAIGPEAPRSIIARARYTLQFEDDNPEKLSDAVGAVGGVLRRTPDALSARTLMAALLLAGDEPDQEQAVEHLRRAADVHPQRWDLYPRLIALLQAQGEFGEAEEYLVRLGGASSLPPELRRAELELLRAQGSLGSAIARLESIIDDEADEADLLTLAAWYAEDGRHERAAEVYERVLASEPSALARLQAANLFADRGDPERALALLEAIDAGAPSPERSYRTAQFLLEHGDRERGLELLRSALEAAPDRVDMRAALAHELARRGAFEEARRIAGASSHPALRSIWLVASLQQGGDARNEALAVLRDSHGRREATWLATETLIDQCGDAEPTVRDLEAARSLTKQYEDFLPAWEAAITLHRRAGELGTARTLAERATFRFPNHPQPAEWWTRVLVADGRLAEAIEAATYWRDRTLGRPIVADVVIASLHLDLNEPAHAVAIMDRHAARIRREGGHQPEWLLVLARTLLLSGELDEAMALATPRLADASWSRTWFGAIAQMPPPQAIETLARVEPLAAGDAALRRSLASSWADLARRTNDPALFDRADRWARELEGSESLLLRGSIAEGRGDLEAAEGLYRETLAIAPADPIAMNNLAAVLLDRGRGQNEAVALAGRAVDLAPDIPDLHDTHAQALISLGRAEEAIEAANLAIALDASRPSLHVTLARALLEAGRPSEARAAVNRIDAMLADGASPASDSVRSDLEALRQRLGAGARTR